ncbi:MAG: cyclic pyranopterin monophosphate synthase MoaC [Polyangiales bacterium]
MVDVSDKSVTSRQALAVARVRTTRKVAALILGLGLPKGDVSAVARIAAILGAKRTSELIPLCHPLSLTNVRAEVAVSASGLVKVSVFAACVGPTGVEMEAMTGASIGALTIYDMIKGIDRNAFIERVELMTKSGGRSGRWRRT